MADPIEISKVMRFESFELNLKTGELRKSGIRIRLQDQSFQILAALLERPGKLLTREALHERLWPDETFVDFEKGLNIAVSKLRQALGDSADDPRFIETLPRRGYRFVGAVEQRLRHHKFNCFSCLSSCSKTSCLLVLSRFAISRPHRRATCLRIFQDTRFPGGPVRSVR